MDLTTNTGDKSPDTRFCAPESVLKGQVSRTLKELRKIDPRAKRADAEEALARIWGREGWHALRKNALDFEARTMAGGARGGANEGRGADGSAFSPRTASREEWLDLVALAVNKDSENSSWETRAVSLAQGLVGVFFDERPEGDLHVDQLRTSMDLRALMEKAPNLPQTPAGDAIRRYLENLPGAGLWDGRGDNVARDLHGYVTMQFTDSSWAMMRALERHADVVISRSEWLGGPNGLGKLTKAAREELEFTWLDPDSPAGQHSLYGWALRQHAKGRKTLNLGDIARIGMDALVPQQSETAAHWLRQAEKVVARARAIDKKLSS